MGKGKNLYQIHGFDEGEYSSMRRSTNRRTDEKLEAIKTIQQAICSFIVKRT